MTNKKNKHANYDLNYRLDLHWRFGVCTAYT